MVLIQSPVFKLTYSLVTPLDRGDGQLAFLDFRSRTPVSTSLAIQWSSDDADGAVADRCWLQSHRCTKGAHLFLITGERQRDGFRIARETEINARSSPSST